MNLLINRPLLTGLASTFAFALPAWLLGKCFPLIGGPVWGILLGMLWAYGKQPVGDQAGITFAAKKILQYAIILLGFEMNLQHIIATGSQSLAIICFTLGAAFLTAWLAGKYLNVSGPVSILIGVGTAICGGSAIAAAAPAIRAGEKDVAYSISTIFLFNIAAVFIFPLLGHALRLSDTGFGMWAGTAINDTSSVVAAGYSYSQNAGSFATIVKLTRTLMIIPVTLALSLLTARKQQLDQSFSFVQTFPWFILGFVLASVVHTLGLVPPALCDGLAQTGKFLIIVAMAGIGLKTSLPHLVSNGLRPVLLGLACWIAVAVVSLAVQHDLQLW